MFGFFKNKSADHIVLDDPFNGDFSNQPAEDVKAFREWWTDRIAARILDGVGDPVFIQSRLHGTGEDEGRQFDLYDTIEQVLDYNNDSLGIKIMTSKHLDDYNKGLASALVDTYLPDELERLRYRNYVERNLSELLSEIKDLRAELGAYKKYADARMKQVGSDVTGIRRSVERHHDEFCDFLEKWDDEIDEPAPKPKPRKVKSK